MNLPSLEKINKYYQPIFDYNVSYDLLILVDKEGKIISGAYSGQNILDYCLQDFVGRNLSTLFLKSEAEFCKSSLQSLMNNKLLIVSESKLKHKNKKQLAVEVTGKIITYLEKEIGVLSFKDSTDRKNLKLELQNKTTKFNLVTSNINDFIWMFDLNKKVKYVSESCFNFLGYTVEELSRIDINKVHTESSNKLIAKSLVSAFEEQRNGSPLKGIHLEIEYVKKDNTTFFAEVSAHIIVDDNNKPIGFGGVSRDITTRIKAKKIQEKLNLNLLQKSKEVTRANSLLEGEKIKLNDTINELVLVKDGLTESHKEITESITYAMTIQEALLTRRELIDTWIDNYFIYYEPKYYVGGDFYYINKIKDLLIIAVGDCTGHGVPGALITMIAITYLHDIIKREESNNPGDALNILREKIKDLFKDSSTVNHNGMDIALCGINTKTHVLEYAGAFSPLWIVRDKELLEYKAVRNPISSYPLEEQFKNNRIQLLDGDQIYLFSDGFKDQFGGSNNKKFGRNRFIQVIKEICHLPMLKQNEILEKTFLTWKGNTEQIDDVTVFGMEYKY